MTKDLYVKHLPDDMQEEEIRKLFSISGKVNYIHMVRDAKSGIFLGCAYVKMASEAEAKDAILSLDGARLQNRELSVQAALPQRPRGMKPTSPTPPTSSRKGDATSQTQKRGTPTGISPRPRNKGPSGRKK